MPSNPIIIGQCRNQEHTIGDHVQADDCQFFSPQYVISGPFSADYTAWCKWMEENAQIS